MDEEAAGNFADLLGVVVLAVARSPRSTPSLARSARDTRLIAPRLSIPPSGDASR